MADKEATVYIIDVGESMGRKCNGRTETDLEWAMQYVWDKITTTIGTGRKTAHVGVVGLRTEDTANELADDEENYQNLTVFQPLGQVLMPDLRRLREKVQLSNTDDGDAISAIILAIQMIASHCKTLKYKKKIVLVTNGLGVMDADDIDQISSKIKVDSIELIILGVDFDDPDFGFKEENKDPTKELNESVFHQLTQDCNGMFGTMAQAISELGIPRTKTVRPVTTYKGILTLGDPDTYDSAMCINVERYPRIMQASPPSASQFVVKSDMAPSESNTQVSATLQNGDNNRATTYGGDLAPVKNTRTYQVDDPEAPEGKREIDPEELEKGFEYGRTAVALSQSDMNVVRLETTACLDIVGFVPRDKYERYLTIKKSSIIIANKTNDKASMALSSLIHALYELDSYAVARFVAKDWKEPLLLLLAPSIEPDFECLVDIELPFAEDIRQYKFPPLDKVVTVAGKNLFQHRNLPSDELMDAMSKYVDSMDLSTFGRDDEGNPTEYATMEDTYNPVLHRINHIIRWRAVHPTGELPQPFDILTKYSNPPAQLMERAQPALESIIKAADVKKVPPKQKGRKRGRDTEKPLSGLDVESLLGREKRVKISPENAIPEFKQLLATTENSGAINEASKQMGTIIENYIRYSTGDSDYGRAIEAIRVMREELNDFEEPRLFNDFMRQLKKRILNGDLDGDRREMWWRIRVSRLGLLDKKTNPMSDVSEDEAKTFLSAK